jgi:hypothetical protein
MGLLTTTDTSKADYQPNGLGCVAEFFEGKEEQQPRSTTLRDELLDGASGLHFFKPQARLFHDLTISTLT